MSGQAPTGGGMPQAGQLGMGPTQPNMPAYGLGQGPNAMQMMGAPQQSMGPYPGMPGGSFGPQPGPPGNVQQGPIGSVPPHPMPPQGMPPPMTDGGGGFFGRPQFGGMSPIQQYLARQRGQ